MNKLHFASFATLATLAIAGFADAKLAGGSQGAKAHFHASGPAGLAIEGTTSDVTVTEEGGNVKVAVALGALNTGVQLRDDHMRNKYLEVGKFPSATLSVARGSLKFPADGATSSGDAQGTINIHGQDKPVTFHYQATRKGSAIAVTGSATVNMADHGISVPSYLGVTVKKEVSVDVSFSAQD